MTSATPAQKTQLDALIVANHLEAINGLLYVSGGGWTDLHRRIRGSSAPASHFGIGMIVRVPWQETNQPHHFTVDIRSDQDNQMIAHAEGEIRVGQPPQLARGSEQHAVVAITIDTTFPNAGGYHVIAAIDGEHMANWSFRVHDTCQ